MHHLEPWASCFLLKPCAPPPVGALEDLVVGLTFAAGVWLAVFFGLGLGRRSGRV